MKVERLVVELQFEPIHGIPLQGLLDKMETLTPDFLVQEVEACVARPVFVDTNLGPNLQGFVVETEVRPPTVLTSHTTALLHEQCRVDGRPFACARSQITMSGSSPRSIMACAF